MLLQENENDAHLIEPCCQKILAFNWVDMNVILQRRIQIKNVSDDVRQDGKMFSLPFSYTFSLHVPLSHISWLLCVHKSSRLKLLSYQLMIGCIYWSALDIKMTTWFCDPAAATGNNRPKGSCRKVTDEREDAALAHGSHLNILARIHSMLTKRDCLSFWMSCSCKNWKSEHS